MDNKRSKNSRIEDWLNTIDTRTSLDESDNKMEISSPRNTESFPKGSDPIDPLLSDKPCNALNTLHHETERR